MKVKKLTLCALFTALCCLLTLSIRIPSPGGGYVNLGDCAVLLSAWVLGPAWGAAAAGLGSMLSDLLGYPLYAPATLLVKGGMGLCAGLLFSRLGRGMPAMLLSGIAAECIMVGGYFLFESAVLGMGLGAAVNLPANAIQGVFGLAAAAAAGSLLRRSLPRRAG